MNVALNISTSAEVWERKATAIGKKCELAVCYARPKYSFRWIIWSHPRYIRVKIKHKSEKLILYTDLLWTFKRDCRRVSVDVSHKTFLSFAAQLWEDAWHSSQITSSIIHDEDERNDKVPRPNSGVSVQVKCSENRTFIATVNSLGPFSALFSGKSDSFSFIWRFKVYVTHMDI